MHNFKLLPTSTRTGWQAELADAVTSVAELLHLLELDHIADRVVSDPGFRLRVPRAFVDKMQRGNSADPLLRQVLPLIAENDQRGLTDPVGDLEAMTSPGVLHKYRGRVLLITTGACAVHCRYCFRRHFPYADANPGKNGWHEALAYLATHDDIREVILSGGDPLLMTNDKLGLLLAELEQITHIKWLRIHTRIPLVLPSRIDAALITLLHQLRFDTTIVIHANHANELMADEARALNRLADGTTTLLNQSVLLRGVNDSADALSRLSTRLFDCRVLPYYLHMLDPVQGAMHFDVPQDQAVTLIDELRANLPGYLVPRLVREIQGETSKTAIFTI